MSLFPLPPVPYQPLRSSRPKSNVRNLTPPHTWKATSTDHATLLHRFMQVMSGEL
jgi:hypothetical protein